MGTEAGSAPLDQQFANFARFGDNKSDGKTITLSCSDRWMRQAKVLDMKTITTTHTGIAFNKFKTRAINYQNFLKYLNDLAASTDTDVEEIKEKLMACGMPGATKGENKDKENN
ncbi:tubulin polymerization-promoting protein homolog [Onthophagus taurus]|uniref:tubulin polymerization-promoting protein homolog n=1 Tax=Onthophagus taurus TaxID=166361 RepID=UPI0039BE386C